MENTDDLREAFSIRARNTRKLAVLVVENLLCIDERELDMLGIKIDKAYIKAASLERQGHRQGNRDLLEKCLTDREYKAFVMYKRLEEALCDAHDMSLGFKEAME